jgi:hypothetical protein
MGQQIVGNRRSLRAQLPDGAVEINRVPMNNGGGDKAQTGCAETLLFEGAVSNFPCRWKNTARRSALLASPLLRPAWLRWHNAGSDNHCRVNSVSSIRRSARRARDRTLPAAADASWRRMTDGTTAPVSIEALSRMSSGHCRRSPASRPCRRSMAQVMAGCRPSQPCGACVAKSWIPLNGAKSPKALCRVVSQALKWPVSTTSASRPSHESLPSTARIRNSAWF